MVCFCGVQYIRKDKFDMHKVTCKSNEDQSGTTTEDIQCLDSPMLCRVFQIAVREGVKGGGGLGGIFLPGSENLRGDFDDLNLFQS